MVLGIRGKLFNSDKNYESVMVYMCKVYFSNYKSVTVYICKVLLLSDIASLLPPSRYRGFLYAFVEYYIKFIFS